MSKADKKPAEIDQVVPDDIPSSDEILKKSTTLMVYVGTRNERNERHGNSWTHSPNDCFYKGTYRNGLRHGYGLYVFPNGARYIGNYRNGLRHGLGTFFYPDNSTYVGEWKANQRHGRGRYTYSNGDSYEGFWRKGQRSHNGTYTVPANKGGTSIRGTWKDGYLRGPTEIKADKMRLRCEWNQDVASGPAVYIIDSKAILHGTFLQEPLLEPQSNRESTSETTCENLSTTAIENQNENTSKQSLTTLMNAAPSTYWECNDIKPYEKLYLPPDIPFQHFIDSDEESNVIESNGINSHQSIDFNQIENSFANIMTQDLLMEIRQNAFQIITDNQTASQKTDTKIKY